MKKQILQKSFYGTAVAALLVLSGCDWCCKKKCGASSSMSKSNVKDDSTVLLSIDGKPVVTEAQFRQYYEQFIAANPRLQGMIQFLPNAEQEIFKGMANEEIVVYWAEKNNLADTAEYQKEFEQAVKMIRRGLAAKSFEQQMIGKVSATEAEMKDYYEKHKNPELIVTPGGIKAVGVEFDDKAQAQAFLDKVKAAPTNLKALAAQAKHKVREFAPVNAQSFDLDKNVKDKLSELKSFPSVHLIAAIDKKFWVVSALNKEDAKYRSFEEVREGLKNAIEREKMGKIWVEKIDDLRKKYNISENIAFFEKKNAQPAPMQDLDFDSEQQAETKSA